MMGPIGYVVGLMKSMDGLSMSTRYEESEWAVDVNTVSIYIYIYIL